MNKIRYITSILFLLMTLSTNCFANKTLSEFKVTLSLEDKQKNLSGEKIVFILISKDQYIISNHLVNKKSEIILKNIKAHSSNHLFFLSAQGHAHIKGETQLPKHITLKRGRTIEIQMKTFDPAVKPTISLSIIHNNKPYHFFQTKGHLITASKNKILKYSFTGLPPSNFRIVIGGQNYEKLKKDISLTKKNQTVHLNLDLLPKLRIHFEKNNETIPKQLQTIFFSNKTFATHSKYLKKNKEGFFECYIPPATTSLNYAFRDHARSRMIPINLQKDMPIHNIKEQYYPGITKRFIIQDLQGKPINQAKIAVTSSNSLSFYHKSNTSNNNGIVNFYHITGKSFTLRVESKKYKTFSTKISLNQLKTFKNTITLPLAYNLSFKLFHSLKNEPLKKTKVTATIKTHDNIYLLHEVTDRQGAVRFYLKNKNYTSITIQPHNYLPTAIKAFKLKNSTKVRNVLFNLGGQLTIKILGNKEKKIAAPYLATTDQGESFYAKKTIFKDNYWYFTYQHITPGGFKLKKKGTTYSLTKDYHFKIKPNEKKTAEVEIVHKRFIKLFFKGTPSLIGKTIRCQSYNIKKQNIGVNFLKVNKKLFAHFYPNDQIERILLSAETFQPLLIDKELLKTDDLLVNLLLSPKVIFRITDEKNLIVKNLQINLKTKSGNIPLSYSSRSNNQGVCYFNSLGPGTYRIYSRDPRILSFDSEILIENNSLEEFDISVNRGKTLKLEIYDAETNQPISNKSIHLFIESKFGRTASTDQLGNVSFTGINDDYNKATIEVWGYIKQPLSFDTAQEIQRVFFHKTKTFTLTFLTNQKIRAPYFKIRSSENPKKRFRNYAISQINGKPTLVLRSYLPGKYQVDFSSNSHKSFSMIITIDTRSKLNTLSHALFIKNHLSVTTNVSAKSIVGVFHFKNKTKNIKGYHAGGSSYSFYLDHGNFQRVRLKTSGYQSSSLIKLTKTHTSYNDISYQFSKGNKLILTIVDKAGTPLKGAQVNISGKNFSSLSGKSNSMGIFEGSGFSQQTYSVSIYNTNYIPQTYKIPIKEVTTRKKIVLEKGVDFSFEIADAKTGDLLKNSHFRISIYSDKETTMKGYNSDKYGIIRLNNISSSVSAIKIVSSAHHPLTIKKESLESHSRFELQSGLQLKIIVKNGNGAQGIMSFGGKFSGKFGHRYIQGHIGYSELKTEGNDQIYIFNNLKAKKYYYRLSGFDFEDVPTTSVIISHQVENIVEITPKFNPAFILKINDKSFVEKHNFVQIQFIDDDRIYIYKATKNKQGLYLCKRYKKKFTHYRVLQEDTPISNVTLISANDISSGSVVKVSLDLVNSFPVSISVEANNVKIPNTYISIHEKINDIPQYILNSGSDLNGNRKEFHLPNGHYIITVYDYISRWKTKKEFTVSNKPLEITLKNNQLNLKKITFKIDPLSREQEGQNIQIYHEYKNTGRYYVIGELPLKEGASFTLKENIRNKEEMILIISKGYQSLLYKRNEIPPEVHLKAGNTLILNLKNNTNTHFKLNRSNSHGGTFLNSIVKDNYIYKYEFNENRLTISGLEDNLKQFKINSFSHLPITVNLDFNNQNAKEIDITLKKFDPIEIKFNVESNQLPLTIKVNSGDKNGRDYSLTRKHGANFFLTKKNIGTEMTKIRFFLDQHKTTDAYEIDYNSKILNITLQELNGITIHLTDENSKNIQGVYIYFRKVKNGNTLSQNRIATNDEGLAIYRSTTIGQFEIFTKDPYYKQVKTNIVLTKANNFQKFTLKTNKKIGTRIKIFAKKDKALLPNCRVLLAIKKGDTYTRLIRYSDFEGMLEVPDSAFEKISITPSGYAFIILDKEDLFNTEELTFGPYAYLTIESTTEVAKYYNCRLKNADKTLEFNPIQGLMTHRFQLTKKNPPTSTRAFRGLPPGTYTFIITQDEMQPSEPITFTASSGKNNVVKVNLERYSYIKVIPNLSKKNWPSKIKYTLYKGEQESHRQIRYSPYTTHFNIPIDEKNITAIDVTIDGFKKSKKISLRLNQLETVLHYELINQEE